jgi:hypothetical protein
MHDCPSVPTALDVAAQHLVIKVGVAVSQNLIETVQLRARRSSFSVNVRNKYLTHSADKGCFRVCR